MKVLSCRIDVDSTQYVDLTGAGLLLFGHNWERSSMLLAADWSSGSPVTPDFEIGGRARIVLDLVAQDVPGAAQGHLLLIVPRAGWAQEPRASVGAELGDSDQRDDELSAPRAKIQRD